MTLAGSIVRLMVRPIASMTTEQSSPCTEISRAPRWRLLSSTSLTTAWKAPSACWISAKSVSCAHAKNGS
jgi:hypothetical protein